MFFKDGDLPCRQINDYALEESLGRGGMASVHRAREISSGREVAVKLGPGVEVEGEFLRELQHPRLPEVYAVWPDGLAMELLQGTSLDQWRERTSEQRVLEWAAQLCDVLEYLHEEGVIFRDLKPANVMITPDGVKLVDFGIAKQGVTRKVVRGLLSRGYAPPEQYAGQGTDEGSDIYALGCTLYYALTLQAPPESVDVERGLVVGLTVRGLRPDVSERTEQALAAMMEVSREARPASIAQVREMLL